MKCPNCGNELSDGTRFCTHCGRPVNRQQSPNQNPNWNPNQRPDQNLREAPEKKNRMVLVIVLVAVLAVAAIGAFSGLEMLLSRESGKETGDFLPVSRIPGGNRVRLTRKRGASI